MAGANLLLADPKRLLRAVEAGDAGLWEWDLARNMLSMSASLSAQLGLPAGASQIPVETFFECIHHDDIALFRVALGGALHAEQPFAHEFRVDPDGGGEMRWLSFRGQVLDRNGDGEPTSLSGLCLEVTDRRHTQEAYDLLNRELSHRIKNLFSVVSSLVNMTSEHRPEAQTFVAALQERLKTFAATHEALVKGSWHTIPLESLVEKALSPLGVWSRVDLRSTGLLLSAQDAQTVVFVLHELATNAIKYGALSNGTGRVELSFKFELPSAEGGPALIMVWSETGGPPVPPLPSMRGFGIRFIERLTKRQQSGEAVLDWRPEGLRCCIELPVTPTRR